MMHSCRIGSTSALSHRETGKSLEREIEPKRAQLSPVALRRLSFQNQWQRPQKKITNVVDKTARILEVHRSTLRSSTFSAFS